MSLADTCMMASTRGIGVVASVMGNGAFIELSRNQFVKIFLDTDCTHLFFIDADLRWEARAFCGLVEGCTPERPVVAGAYRRRQPKEDYPIRYWEDAAEPGLTFVDGGWVLCERVATGFLCIHRSVVVEMANEARLLHVPMWGDAPELFYTQDVPMMPEETKMDMAAWNAMLERKRELEQEIEDLEKTLSNGKWLFMGEDISWCDDYVHKYKKYIHVWPDFDFIHAGLHCNWRKFILKELASDAKEEQERLEREEAKLKLMESKERVANGE
jgi:hypothetical protein